MEQNNPTNDSNWNTANNSGNGFNSGNDGFNNGGNMNRGNGFGDQFNQNFNKLPADPLALTLGIISLVLFLIGCWCYGIVGIVTLIMSIIGLVQANRSLKIYEANPDQYAPSSYKNVNTAKILNIIAVILSAIACLVVVVIAIFFGAIFASAMNGEFKGFDDLESGGDDYYNEDYEYDESEDGVYQYEEELDSLQRDQDTLQIEEMP
ncbi:MAG: CCC motif membrane protein [Nonlabens sp.]|nr:CCC motif membrane protein [Nonlabens sp.]MDP5100951.1 CCC motif membrane protein [Nonlabens sp.]